MRNAKSLDILPRLSVTLDRTDCRYSISAIMRNMSYFPIEVNPLGMVLQPDDEEFQRLFVAGREERPGILHVPAGRVARINLATVCMDGALRIPTMKIEYEVSTQEAPRELIKAARAWQARRLTDLDIDSGDGRDFLIPPKRHYIDLAASLADLELVAHGKAVTLS